MKELKVKKDMLVNILKQAFVKMPFFVKGGNPVAIQLLKNYIFRNGINPDNFYVYEDYSDCSMTIKGEEIETKNKV